MLPSFNRDQSQAQAEAGPSSSSSSTHSSPSQLPYLRDSVSPDPGPGSDLPDEPLQSELELHEGKTPRPRASLNLPTEPQTRRSLSPTLSVGSSSSSSSRIRKRPPPLVLGRQEVGQDEELTAQLQVDGNGRWGGRKSPLLVSRRSSGSGGDEVEFELGSSKDTDFKGLRRSSADREGGQGIRQRPTSGDVDEQSPKSHTASLSLPRPPAESILPTLPPSAFIDVSTLPPPDKDSDVLMIDTRPLASHLTSHLPHSVNINIPSLIYKRLRKSGGAGATSDTLNGYITTPAGREQWASWLENRGSTYIIGLSEEDEVPIVFKSMMNNIGSPDSVKIIRGGWPAVLSNEAVLATLVSDDEPQDQKLQPPHGHLPRGSTYPPPTSPRSHAHAIPTFHIAPPIPSPPPGPGGLLSTKQSMPSLRTGIKRNVPNLSIQVDPHTKGSGPTRLTMPPRSASAVTGKFPSLHLDIAATRGGAASKSPARSPIHGSFQQACLAQSKLPPSPSSFADITLPTPAQGPWTSRASSSSNQQSLRGGGGPGARTGPARNAIAPFIVSTILPQFLYLGPEISSMDEVKELQRLGIKRILNVAMECEDNQGLGLANEFERYHKIPMRDIVEETGVKKYMWQACDFLNDARLHSAPVYVHCKAGKSRSVTVVLAYLIHANAWTLKTAYTYVAEHRKGISPNIGFVAELMQFEESELGLKQSGGVHGEAAQPEDNVDYTNPKSASGSNDPSGTGDVAKKPSPRKHKYSRESLPPAWAMGSSSLGDALPKLLISSHKDEDKGGPRAPSPSGRRDSTKREEEERGKDRKVTDEREVRKNGHWVQQRRAPVDRTTLQPGRRASKAGLESLRIPSGNTSTDKQLDVGSSTGPEGDREEDDKAKGKGAVTPGGEGPLKWI